MSLMHELRVEPGSTVDLSAIRPDGTPGFKENGRPKDEIKADADARREENVARLTELTDTLWADNRFALLVILQGMDTSGKDGTIRRVLSGVNPQGCRVHSFKRPTDEELEHDYLWRVHRECPRRGEIGVFNRSHYEDVGVVRVNELVPKSVWSKRYDQINDFERMLTESGTRIVKIFLHISKEEQKQRLEERLRDPVKGWKMQLDDLKVRTQWGEYMRAYEDAIRKCSTAHAPWHIVPADKKWYRNLAVSSILVETLESMDLRIPKVKFDLGAIKIPD